MWLGWIAGAGAHELDLEAQIHWVDDWTVPLAGHSVQLRDGCAYPIATETGVASGFVFVGTAEAAVALGPGGDQLGLAGPLEGELGLDVGELRRDGVWHEKADVVVVLGRGDLFNAAVRALPVLEHDDKVSYVDPEGRQVVVVTAFDPGKGRNVARDALRDRVASLTELGLDPRTMIGLDAYRDDARWLAEVRTGHAWDPFLVHGGDRWLSWSHDPTGAVDDSFVDRVYVHDHGEARVITGTRPRLAFEGAHVSKGTVNVVLAPEGTGNALDVEIEALLTLVADTRTAIVPLVVPRGEEEADESIVSVAAGYALADVSVGDVALSRVGDRFGRLPAGQWDAGTWRLPEVLGPGDQVEIRVRWTDRWALAHRLEIQPWAAHRLKDLGVCHDDRACSAIVNQWPEWADLGRVAASHAVLPLLPDRPGTWPAEIRVGTTLPERWRAAIGGSTPVEDGGDGRWWIASTEATARVSFGDLTEARSAAYAGFPAMRVLQLAQPEGNPQFVRAALNFLEEPLPPYPYGELAVVQAPSRPILGQVPAATQSGVHPQNKLRTSTDNGMLTPRVFAYPGQIVVQGLLEVGEGGPTGVEAGMSSDRPHDMERAVVHALAEHWWDRPAYAERDRWIGAAVSGWFRDRFVDEAWGSKVADRWERLRRADAEVRVAEDRWVPVVALDDSGADALGVGLLRALGARLGEDKVLQGLDAFLQGPTPTTEALRDALSAAARIDVEPFFDAWVLAGVRPTVDGAWSVGDGTIHVSLTTDTPKGMRLELPIAVYPKNGKREGEPRISWVTVIDGRGSADLVAKGAVARIEVDPEHWLPLRGGRSLRGE